MAAVRESFPTQPPEGHMRRAYLHLRDARAAMERPMTNESQIADVMRSVEHFITCAKTALKEGGRQP